MPALRTLLEATPFFGCMLAAGALALVAQAWLLRQSFRRRARRRALRSLADVGDWATVAAAPIPRAGAEVVALATLLLVPAATMVSVQHARGLVSQSLEAPDPARRAELVIAGWKGQLDAIPLGIALEELAGGLGVIAWSFAFAARRQIGGLVWGARMGGDDPAAARAWARAPGPATEAVVGCAGSICAMGVLPVLQGAFSYCVILGRGLSRLQVGGAAPAERLGHVDALLVEARHALEAGTSAGRVGLLLAVLTSSGLLWWRSPVRARRQNLGRAAEAIAPPPAARERVTWGTIACVVVAAALYLGSRPLRAENRAGWPSFDHAERTRLGPTVEVTASAARLDGTPVEATELWRRLDRGRASSAQPGDLQVTCPGDTPTARLTPVLHAARAAGWTAPLLVLGWRETVRRPLLGTFRRERTAHARARLVTVLDSKQPGTAVLRPEADPTCAALAAHLVDLQRQGLALALDVP